MLRFLKKLVPTEVRDLIVGKPPHHTGYCGGTSYPGQLPTLPRKERETAKLRRRSRARRDEAISLANRQGGLYPPKQGSRRPEWSSAVPGQWSTLNGLSVEELQR